MKALRPAQVLIRAFLAAALLGGYAFLAVSVGHDHGEHESGTAAVRASSDEAGENELWKAMEPIHPKLVHFPIALFMTAPVLALLGRLRRSGRPWAQGAGTAAVYVYAIAALMTPVVAASGLHEAAELGLHHPLLETHRDGGMLLMWTSLMSLPVLWGVRRLHPRTAPYVWAFCLATAAALVTWTGHHGGRMVYEYGVGVEGM